MTPFFLRNSAQRLTSFDGLLFPKYEIIGKGEKRREEMKEKEEGRREEKNGGERREDEGFK
ncbi:MAG: hypothetical protein ACTSRR_08615 [Candidatus Heimdallarchaeaceae archaeon]